MTERVHPGLVAASCGGLCLGVMTVRWVASLYPPTRDHWWPMLGVTTASMTVILILYLMATFLDVRRAGDWLVLGYTAALLIAASIAITQGFVEMVRERVPESIGVNTAAVSHVECPG